MRWPEKGWRDKVRGGFRVWMRDMNGGLGCGGWGAGVPCAITSVCERLHGRVMATITVISAALLSI